MTQSIQPDPTALETYPTNSKGIKLDPRLLLQHLPEIDRSKLEALAGCSIVHASQFDRGTVVALAQLSARLESQDVETVKPLDGKLVVTAFFEASTRTRLSFESAVQRLDGKVLSVPDGQVTGIAKGESMADIGEMLNTYGDLVIMRHPQTEAVDEILENLTRPLINAGNGSGQHPSQALLDWFALLKWRPALALADCPAEERIHLGIVGTPGSMRAVKSFVRLALLFTGAVERITIISEMVDPVGYDLGQDVAASPVPVEFCHDLAEVVGELDVVYMNSIALLGDSYRQLDSRYKIDGQTKLRHGAVVMHPLARRAELDRSLDHSRHNLYFAQAAGAVFSRQALLTCVLGRLDRLGL